MTKKSQIFLAISIVAAVALSYSTYQEMFWATLVTALIYLTSVILTAALPSDKKYAFIYIPIWLILAVIFIKQGIWLFTVMAIPSVVLFWLAKKNFSLRIKIDFIESIRPALTMYFVCSILLGASYIAITFDPESAKNFIKSHVDENIELSSGNMSLQSLLPEAFFQDKLNLIKSKCQGEPNCERLLQEGFDEYLSPATLGNINLKEKVNTQEQIDNIFNSLDQQTIDMLGILIGLIIAIIFTPLSFIFSLITSIVITMIYMILRVMGVFVIETIKVDQESLA